MEKLKIALCQNDIAWEDAAATIEKIEPAVRRFCEMHSPDILVFPETYSVGFTMNPAVAESEDGISANWLRYMASETGAAVIGSVPVLESGKRYNRCHFICPDGTEYHYDKRHLFNPSGEGATYTPGTERCTVNYLGWNIELNVCYDLRFPVWSRNVGNSYDLLVNIANWPDSRIEAAQMLVKARANENCCYALFCNRVGKDTVCNYNGKSAILNYFGHSISQRSVVCGTTFLRAELSLGELCHYHERFPAWKDADSFEVKL